MFAGRNLRWVLLTLVSMIRERLGAHLVVLPFDDSGTRIVADLRTGLGRRMYRYRVPYEDADFVFLEAVLDEGDIFVDCGANVGMYTLAASNCVGRSGRVISFEAAPETRAALEKNINENALENVWVEPFALSDSEGLETFYAVGINGGLSSFAPENRENATASPVKTMPLDLALMDIKSTVRLLKIDVEGAELRVLRGASETIRASRPWVLIEIEPENLARQGASEAVLRASLAASGYIEVFASESSPNVLFAHTESDVDGVLGRLAQIRNAK